MEEWRQLNDEPIKPLTIIRIDGKPAYIAIAVCDVLRATAFNLMTVMGFSHNVEISIPRKIYPKEAFETLRLCYSAEVEIVCLWTEHPTCSHICIFKRIEAAPSIDIFPMYNEVGFDNRSREEINSQNAQWN